LHYPVGLRVGSPDGHEVLPALVLGSAPIALDVHVLQRRDELFVVRRDVVHDCLVKFPRRLCAAPNPPVVRRDSPAVCVRVRVCVCVGVCICVCVCVCVCACVCVCVCVCVVCSILDSTYSIAAKAHCLLYYTVPYLSSPFANESSGLWRTNTTHCWAVVGHSHVDVNFALKSNCESH
jgi:hypothetical protein